MLWPLTTLITILHSVSAINDALFVSFDPSDGSIDISSPTIIVDECDYVGVHIAAEAVAKDFLAVTDQPPPFIKADNSTEFSITNSTVIIGSIQKSCLIKRMVDTEKIDVSSIEGKWESFITAVVADPLPGVARALVIAGSDKRGAIFGAYTLSEEIGVSPWYWWADVVPKKRAKIHATPTQTLHGEPSVKFRGIFLNDEYPGLTTWVNEKFGPVYNSEFYKHVFELLLRMKANFLWPASWPGYPPPGNIFFVDDPTNQKTADDYGIVVSTSHHEPMQRATNEWLSSGAGPWDWEKNKKNITQFFADGAKRAVGFESYFTIGMRGASDSGVVGADPAAIVKEVIATQRQILSDVNGNTTINQVWPLYKEVQALYEAGLEIPEDVTLLFADDNYGSIRRFPTEAERQRPGGIGVYYHLGYVGSPRAYKWMNTNSLGKIHQQFSSAYEAGIDRIWVVNVGDLKPLETPISFVLAMAWNVTSVTADSIPSWLEAFAAREFPEEHASEIADLLLGHSRLMGLRRHATTESTTFSLLNYNEADKILGRWSELLAKASALEENLPESIRPSFFQLVLHPIQASHTYFALRVTQAKNTQYAVQRRNSANGYAQDVLDYFDMDFDVEERYHSILDGKWNHIIRQPHYGYGSSFHTPSRNMITGLSYVQNRQLSSPSVGQMGVSVEGQSGVRPGLINEGSDVTKPSRGDLQPGLTLPTMTTYGRDSSWFEVWARGTVNIDWSASPAEPWVTISPALGTLSQEQGWDERITITINWDLVPVGFNGTTLVRVNSTEGSYEEVRLPVINTAVDKSFRGFVEGDRYISMEAAHFTTSTTGEGVRYADFPWLSRGLSGTGAVALTPSTAISSIPGGPYLDYTFFQVSPVTTLNVTLFFTTTLDTDPTVPRTFALSLDGSEPKVTRLMAAPAAPGDLPAQWTTAVQDLVWRHSVTLPSGKGEHILRYWAGTGGVLLERIIIDMGGIRTSYLGPPESRRL